MVAAFFLKRIKTPTPMERLCKSSPTGPSHVEFNTGRLA
jgi:hypothetical protein